MKKLYKDIRFAKCILALTAGWFMAGCSAEDELGNGSAAQQLSIIPMVNDLQTTRVKEEENLHEKTLSSLDFKMFEPTNGDCRIDRQFTSPAENQPEVLASGNWKESLSLQPGQSYAYYAAANTQQSLQGKSQNELQNATQLDEDIWKPYSTDNSEKLFLMSSYGSCQITEEAEQDIPVELVRAAAKIKLNISSTVKDYHISDVQWKLINYNTNTTIFAGQTTTPSIISDNNTWSTAASAKDEKGNDVFTVTTYSYSTQWETQKTMPQIVAKVNFKYKDDSKTDILKELNIPVRDPQGDKKLDRNYIYTVNAVIKYLDTKTDIDYDGDTDYLKWAIAKWTQGEDTYVKGDKASFLVVYPTQLDLKALTDWNKENWCIDWFASSNCNTDNNRQAYYFDKYGYKKEDQNLVGQTISQVNTSTGDNNRGRITIHGSKPEQNTILYINFLVKTNDGSKSQKVNVRKYPAIYSLNVANAEASDKQNTQNRLYTLQFTTNQGISDYTIAKPQLDSENKSTDKTVSPALIMASAGHSNETAESNEAARTYCQSYSERATTQKGETLDMNGWRLPTTDEVKLINQLANQNKAVDSQILSNACYWTLDGKKTAFNGAQEGNSTYVRCVHDLTLEEIEKIENQGIE